MLLELAVGWWTGSLALTADGWHMGTHALALGGAVLAYRLSLRQRAPRGRPAGFAFGGWKIEVLAAYTSGLMLMAVALWLAWEGVQHAAPAARRSRTPKRMVVAVLGLLVNLASVWLLRRAARAVATAGARPCATHATAMVTAHDHGHSARSSATRTTTTTTTSAPPTCTCWPTPSRRCWRSPRWPAALWSGLALARPGGGVARRGGHRTLGAGACWAQRPRAGRRHRRPATGAAHPRPDRSRRRRQGGRPACLAGRPAGLVRGAVGRRRRARCPPPPTVSGCTACRAAAPRDAWKSTAAPGPSPAPGR